MQKIGILTWFYGANYGAKAQAFALQQVLLDLGFDCVMINYRVPRYKVVNLRTNINCSDFFRCPRRFIEDVRRYRIHDCLNKEIFRLTPEVKTASDIDSLQLDNIVLGSDAIFNVMHPFYSPVYFGVGIRTPLVVYAPSCEYLNTDTVLKQEIREALINISEISVRDNQTWKLIWNNTGKDSIKCLDPTLLYDFEKEYNMCFSTVAKPFLLIYCFSDWQHYSELIKQYAAKYNYKIVSIGNYIEWADFSISAATLIQWLHAFRDAEVIVTDSFHGSVFAIKNNKEFVILGRKDKTCKIMSLMKDLKITRGLYDATISLERYLEKPIDYEKVQNELNELRKKSLQFLENALRK